MKAALLWSSAAAFLAFPAEIAVFAEQEYSIGKPKEPRATRSPETHGIQAVPPPKATVYASIPELTEMQKDLPDKMNIAVSRGEQGLDFGFCSQRETLPA